MMYVSKRTWVHKEKLIISSATQYGDEWIACSSYFEAKVALRLLDWCQFNGHSLVNQERILLTRQSSKLKPRFWTCDFKISMHKRYRIIVEAKGQVDQRFRDVLTHLDGIGCLGLGLIIVAYDEKCLNDLNRLFKDNNPYPVKVVLLNNLILTLTRTAREIGEENGLILP